MNFTNLYCKLYCLTDVMEMAKFKHVIKPNAPTIDDLRKMCAAHGIATRGTYAEVRERLRRFAVITPLTAD